MIRSKLYSLADEYNNKANFYYNKRNYNMYSWACKRVKRIRTLILTLELKK